MCGIFGYVGTKKTAAKTVLSGLKQLEYRGYDSWGVAAVRTEIPNPIRQLADQIPKKNGNTIVIKKKIGKIGSADVSDLPDSDIGFGHTRWATHGGVTDINAHPHLDCSGKIAIIHNGIVENYEELRKKLLKKGHIFKSETDTEVAVHLIEEYAKHTMFSKAVQKAFNEMEGLNAFIVLHADEHKFVAVRNGSPLVVGFGDGENFLASDASALLPHTRQVHFLEDDQMAIVSEKGVMIFNAINGDHISPNKQHLDWSESAVVKGKFPYFMLKEIYEQPGMLADIAVESRLAAEKLADTIKKADNTYIVACGSAGYVGLAASYMMSIIAKYQAIPVVASEFAYHVPFLTNKSVVLALSQSGETMDTLDAVKKARKKGAIITALVNSLGSTLYREAGQKILVGAGPEKAVASTKAVTGKLAHLVLLSYALAGKGKEGEEVLKKTVRAVKLLLMPKNTKRILSLAKMLSKKEHIYMIGRGISYATALEAALKVKEISYMHGEGFAAGELKHGVIALIEKGTPCMAFCPNDETHSDNLAGAMEIQARGGYIIGVSNKPNAVFDFYIPVPDVGVATIIPNIIVSQLLGYYLAIERGYDPDMPRNLAKSVTVK